MDSRWIRPHFEFQEYGWYSDPLVKENWKDRRVRFAIINTEITKFKDAEWKMKEQMNINNWKKFKILWIKIIFRLNYGFQWLFTDILWRHFLSVIVSSWLECILCGVFGADNPTFPVKPSTLDGLLFRIGAMVAIGVVSRVVKDWRLWLFQVQSFAYQERNCVGFLWLNPP